MTAQRIEDAEVVADRGAPVNEVRLVGKVAAAPTVRALPDGEEVCNVRVAVERPEGHTPRRKNDQLECAVYPPRLRRSVEKWSEGDLVEVSGALRRRFFRPAGGGNVSIVEVEVAKARLIRRGASG